MIGQVIRLRRFRQERIPLFEIYANSERSRFRRLVNSQAREKFATCLKREFSVHGAVRNVR